MSVVSPGRWLLIFLVISDLVFNAFANEQKKSGNNKNVVIEILDVTQPYNCSSFFDDLEELLTETSKYAAKINKEQAGLSTFQVKVPRHWDFSVCSGPSGQRRTTYARPSQSTDIIIGRNHPVFGTRPWTLQNRGCGQQGLIINLPYSFLLKNTENSEIKGQILAREWTKYESGVFSERGFKDDRLYPTSFSSGNVSQPSQGCIQNKSFWQFCPANEPYDRSSPTKQNIQCNTKSAAEVIAEKIEQRIKSKLAPPIPTSQSKESDLVTSYVTINPKLKNDNYVTVSTENIIKTNPKLDALPSESENSDMMSSGQNNSQISEGEEIDPSSRLEPQHTPTTSKTLTKREAEKNFETPQDLTPKFIYSLSSTTKYHILLDQTSAMGEHMRWTNVKRALFRFINLLPVGSRLNIHAFGHSVKEVLPTTTVTELNRDGLFGRIPRRVLDDIKPCVNCALDRALYEVGHNEVVILITGVDTKMNNHAAVLKQVEDKEIPIYVISYPATIHTSYMDLARFGEVYAVVENSANLRPLIHLQEILANIITKTESEIVEKIHETHYNSLGFAGTFTYEKEENAELLITLNVPDEEKVELFEIKDPSGKKRIFSKFEDGMVYFKFNGLLPPGIWSYHAKLYHDSLYPDTKMTVDVITKCEVDSGIIAEIFTSVDDTIANVENDPVKLYAKIMKNGLPVLNAAATAELYMPGELNDGSKYSLTLHDNGLGYPDITSGDGIYSTYVPKYAVKPGYYSVRLTVSDNNGQAMVPKGQTRDPETGAECCGSVIDFGNYTSPTGSFQRISTGPAFYVNKGYSLTKDISPPSRIIDFTLLQKEDESLTLHLAWTAPGGDFDYEKAHKYEIRCHTSRDMLSEANYDSKGILVHSDSLPAPLSYGTNQSCTAGVPWTNQIFYYAIVAFDERNNRGPISNIVSVYIHEATTTPTTTTSTQSSSTSLDPYLLLKYLQNSDLNNENFTDDELLKENFLKLSENLVELERSNGEIYIAVGIVCGVVMMIVILLMSLVLISRRKRSVTPAASTTSNTSQDEPNHLDTGKLTKVSKVSPDGSSKVLLSWLESLPKSDSDSMDPISPPSPPTSHNNSLDSTINTISRRNQTLTRTNPYRHKVLTNGSFVSLKDIPTGSEEGSTRLTASTVDDSTSSDTSSSSFNNIGLTSKSIRDCNSLNNPSSVKRSNTSAAQLSHNITPMNKTENNSGLRRTHNTGYYSFRDYSPVYGTATLGRGGVFKSNLSVLAEDNMHGTTRSNRRTKRTESFV